MRETPIQATLREALELLHQVGDVLSFYVATGANQSDGGIRAAELESR